MNENLIIPEAIQGILNDIKNCPKYWAEHPLADLPDYPLHNRKIVVSGFNFPDLEADNDQRIYITIKQILTNKETGLPFKKANAPIWTIYADTWSYLRNQNFQLIEVDKQLFDEEGNPNGTEKSNIKVPTIDYMKYILFNRQAHFVELFQMYLKDFAIAKESELKQI